jgi:hypothetical protein
VYLSKVDEFIIDLMCGEYDDLVTACSCEQYARIIQKRDRSGSLEELLADFALLCKICAIPAPSHPTPTVVQPIVYDQPQPPGPEPLASCKLPPEGKFQW